MVDLNMDQAPVHGDPPPSPAARGRYPARHGRTAVRGGCQTRSFSAVDDFMGAVHDLYHSDLDRRLYWIALLLNCLPLVGAFRRVVAVLSRQELPRFGS